MVAALKRGFKIAEMLIKASADREYRDVSGKTAVEIAMKGNK